MRWLCHVSSVLNQKFSTLTTIVIINLVHPNVQIRRYKCYSMLEKQFGWDRPSRWLYHVHSKIISTKRLCKNEKVCVSVCVYIDT